MVTNNEKPWLVIDASGNISFIDWECAEKLSEDIRASKIWGSAHVNKATMCAIAAVAVATREYVLRTTIPLTKGDKVKS